MTDDDSPEIDKLIEELNSDDYEVCEYAADALGEFGDTRAVEPLIDMLRRTDSHRLVYSAARALGEIGDTRAVEPLVLLFRGGGYPSLSSRFPRRYDDIREAFAGFLIDFGESAVEPLIEALIDEDEEVRRYAVRALKAIGGPRAMELLDDPEQSRIDVLIKTLSDNKESVSNDALEALIKIGEPAVAPLIKEATHLIDTGAVREWKTEMLGQREVNQGWALSQIARAFGEIGDASAVELLIRIISDENVEWECGSEEAAEAIGKIGDARAVEPLVKLLEDDDWGVRESAEEALEKLGHVVK